MVHLQFGREPLAQPHPLEAFEAGFKLWRMFLFRGVELPAR